MTADLFHPKLQKRLLASQNLAKEECVEILWPWGCWGAANGWLMLVGPSPGKAGPNDWVPPSDQRPIRSLARIGKNVSPIQFDSNVGRNKRWRMLFESAIYPYEKSAGDILTSLVNLDWIHCADQRKLPFARLLSGRDTVWKLIQESKPRVVIVLGNPTWFAFSPYVSQFKINEFPKAPNHLPREPLVFQIPGYCAPSILIKSPQHPSRHFFNIGHAEQIAKTVQWFIDLSETITAK